MDLATVTIIIIGTAGALILGQAALIKTMILWRFDALDTKVDEKFKTVGDSIARVENKYDEVTGKIETIRISVDDLKGKFNALEGEHRAVKCFYQSHAKEVA